MSTDNHSDLNDYELIPIKALHDLKKEIQSLRSSLNHEDASSKILVKHMDLDIHLQKKLDKLISHQEELKKRLDKITNYFETAIEEEEEERKTETQLLIAKIAELSEQNKRLHNKIELVVNHKEDIISRIQDLKENFPKITPGSYMLRYKRTKNI